MSDLDSIWQGLLDKDDRTSPAEYPEMVLITRDELANILEEAKAIRVSVKKMRKSDNRADYFVAIEVGGREVTPHVFTEEYKAAYHVALYDWLLNGREKPKLMAFGPAEWPAMPAAEVVVDARLASGIALLRTALVDIRRDGEEPSHPCGPQTYNHFGRIADEALAALDRIR
jgi:hypothetical protein